MPTPTPELGLEKALDSDDTADYLDTALANSLTTLDSLFNNITGHTHADVHQGGPIGLVPASAIPDGSITSAKLADGGIQTIDIADGAVTAPKLAPGSLLPESLFANTWTNQSANYAVAATILWVFCGAAIQVTLPAAATTNRPITVAAVSGNSTVVSAGGSVIGGSLDTTTGAVTNGAVTQGDSFTYKSDGTNWRAV